MNEQSSYRRILHSSWIIGGASVINILIGLIRTKVAAVMLGPTGVGLISLLQILMMTASTLAALGMATVGTKQVAEAVGRGDIKTVTVARRALFWAALFLATVGGLLFWTFRQLLATHVLGDPSLSGAVGWLSLGVALAVATSSQGALLKGLQRTSDVARISVYAVLLSSGLGVGALLIWGGQGILVFVLSIPFASFLFGHWYVAKLPTSGGSSTPLRELAQQWKTLARLGSAFMVTGVVYLVGNLVVRSMVQKQLGSEALGHFQASWAIAMTYIGLVIGAMDSDFYPRLSAEIHDHNAANRMVNEQTEVALLLAGPLLIAMMGLAPWIIELLYTSNFGDAGPVLRWMVLGDVLKIVSWPLGIIILASGDGRTYMITESLAMAVFVGLTWIGLPLMGISATGASFLGMYLFYLPLVYGLAWRRTGFKLKRNTCIHFIILMTFALTVFLAAASSKWFGAGISVTISIVLCIYGLARLGNMAGLEGRLGNLATRCRVLLVRMRVWHE